MAWEINILLWIQENVRNDILSAILIPYTTSCNAGIPWMCLGFVLFLIPKTRKAGLISLFSILIAFLLNDCCLKLIIQRARPFDVIEGLSSLVKRPHGSSFPSGHSCSAFAFAVALFLNSKKRLGVPFLILAVIMGFSRLYVGVHYPTDVLGGLLVSSAVAICISILVNKLLDKLNWKFFNQGSEESNK